MQEIVGHLVSLHRLILLQEMPFTTAEVCRDDEGV